MSLLALSPTSVAPRLRFVPLGPELCLRLPSHDTSLRRSCRSARGSCHRGPQRTCTSTSFPDSLSLSVAQRQPRRFAPCLAHHKKRADAISHVGPWYYCRQRPTLPHSFPCSTIGGIRLNFRVRNGNGCDPDPMTTGILGAWGFRLRLLRKLRRDRLYYANLSHAADSRASLPRRSAVRRVGGSQTIFQRARSLSKSTLESW